MERILENMKEDKKERIINSAIDEFAKYSYEKASTNNIVFNAGISKGLLFHYFGSKKELYDTLVEFVIRKLINEITAEIDWTTTDIFDRIKQIAVVKMKIFEQYPNMFNFIMNLLSQENSHNVDEIMKIYEKYGVNVQSLFGDVFTKNIDFSLFADSSSIEKNINIIRWTLEKYSEEKYFNINSISVIDFEKAIIEIDEYITVLKKAFYK